MLTATLSLHRYFSSAHRYARADLSEAENLKTYGDDYSEDGMGHNFGFEASVLSAVNDNGDAKLSESVLQAAMEEVTSHLDHRYLNTSVGFFNDHVPTTENVARYCFDHLSRRDLGGATLASVRIQEGPRQWAKYTADGLCWLTRQYIINCVHRHHNPDLTTEENQQLYGKCSAIHGHEYRIEVSVGGPINSKTGLVIERARLDKIVKEAIITPYDRTFLNEKVGNTSGEIIVERFTQDLKPHLTPEFHLHLTLRETRKNSFHQYSH